MVTMCAISFKRSVPLEVRPHCLQLSFRLWINGKPNCFLNIINGVDFVIFLEAGLNYFVLKPNVLGVNDTEKTCEVVGSNWYGSNIKSTENRGV
jgi:hypothetical protein